MIPPAPSASRDPMRTDDTVSAQQVDAALMGHLHRHSMPLFLTNGMAVGLIGVALWPHVDRGWLLAWCALALGWGIARHAVARLYLRRMRAGTGPAGKAGPAAAWRGLSSVGAGAGGLIWGGASLMMTGLSPDSIHVIAPFVMAALSAAAVAGFAHSAVSFATFFYPAVVPYGALLIASDGVMPPLTAAFVFFWCALMGVMAAYFNGLLRESTALSIRNGQLVEGLTRARDRAEAASLAKTRFLGNMSHELRTPLNAIIGYSEVMARGVLGPLGNRSYESYASSIHDSGRHLLGIVERVFELSSLEAGRHDLDEGPVDLAAMVAGVKATTAERARAHGITVRADVPDDLPAVRGDAVKLRQILVELVSNAVRFSPVGGLVTIAAGVTREGGLRLVVSDTGPGMSREDLSRATEPFALLELREHTRRASGSASASGVTTPGLGLALVAHMARLHGGTVSVRSRRGEGTRVLVLLPAERLLPAPAAAAGTGTPAPAPVEAAAAAAAAPMCA